MPPQVPQAAIGHPLFTVLHTERGRVDKSDGVARVPAGTNNGVLGGCITDPPRFP